jgi:phosphoribosylaminoimidazole-succinocarboxamide synthase
LAVFAAGERWGARGGLILADTKFEFGRSEAGALTLADEVFTPDSSRWWDAASFRPGTSAPGFDKQFVRDYLTAQPWNYCAPAPDLPESVILGTQQRYQECHRRLLAALG